MKVHLLFSLLLIPFLSLGQDFKDPVSVFFDPEVNICSSVSSADLNGDGLNDILMTTADINVFYRLNNGNGNYGDPVVIFDDEIFGESASAYDVDSDGDLDVIAACSFSNIVIWLENDGNGNFGAPNFIGEGLDSVEDMILKDLDNDDIDDVIVSTHSSSNDRGLVFWYKNNGDGTFAASNIISDVGLDARKITAEDIDGDGFADVVLATYFDSQLLWFKNDGVGNFDIGTSIQANGDMFRTYAVFLKDIDQDGDQDLIASYNSDLVLFENIGADGFDSNYKIIRESAAWAISAGDVDSDGDVDIVASSSVAKTLTVNLNDGNNNFTELVTLATEVGAVNHISITDFDADGDLDIFTTSSLYDEILFFENSVDLPSSVSQENILEVVISPNPSSGDFTVTNTNNLAIEKILLTDIQGKKLKINYSINFDKISVQSDAASGMYVLTLVTKDGEIINELVRISGK